MLPGAKVQDMKKAGNRYQLVTVDDDAIQVDGVIAGIGIQPNVELAQSIGLEGWQWHRRR